MISPLFLVSPWEKSSLLSHVPYYLVLIQSWQHSDLELGEMSCSSFSLTTVSCSGKLFDLNRFTHKEVQDSVPHLRDGSWTPICNCIDEKVTSSILNQELDRREVDFMQDNILERLRTFAAQLTCGIHPSWNLNHSGPFSCVRGYIPSWLKVAWVACLLIDFCK